MKTDYRPILIVLLLLYVVFSGGGGPFSPSVDRVTYVYDQSQGAVPREVFAEIVRLNDETDIEANTYEINTRDGDGNIPDQYKVAAPAAENAGLPALVVQAGESVVATVKGKDQILEKTGEYRAD